MKNKFLSIFLTLILISGVFQLKDCNASDYEIIDLLKSDYGYNDISKRTNAEGRQEFYSDLAEVMREFWDSDEEPALMQNVFIGDIYTIGIICLESYRLTFDEAAAVYETFRSDNPVFYYASNRLISFTMEEKEYVIVSVFEDFRDPQTRKKYQEQIVNYIDSYKECLSTETVSERAKAIHDKLIDSIEYAHVDGTSEPLKNGITCSIIGATEGYGICDAYSKTYQALCTYYGIENIFVANETHSWNIVKLEDGLFYNVDCTWDDYGDATGYEYFLAGTETFSDSHEPNKPDGIGSSFLYELPEISKSRYIRRKKGDVNCDGFVDSIDASVVLEKYAANSTGSSEYVEIDKALGDYNDDGIIDAVDASLILAEYARLSTT